MINKKKAIKKCVLPCILSTTLLSTVVTPINARVNETFDPVRSLRFTSEVTTGQTASKDKTKLNTNIKYSDDKSSATMTITSPDGYNLSLTDEWKESYKSFLDDETIILQDENTSKLSVITNYKNIYRLEVNVKNTDDTLLDTQNIDFQALDITSVQNESLQEESNVANVNSRTTSSVQTSHDSQSMTVKYTSPGSYTWSIPSEVDLNNQQSMTVSATKVNEEANASLKISVSSENGFKMKSSTGRSGAYKITQDGKQIENNSLVLETTSTGTSSTDLKFFAYPGNFMTADTYNDTLTFKAQNGYATGTVLEIEGMKFIVMSQTDDNTYLVIDGESIGNIQFQPNQDNKGNYYNIGTYDDNDIQNTRYDGQNSNTYENSYIDKYLNTTYYNSFPDNIKNAIVPSKIKQEAYKKTGNENSWSYFSKDNEYATKGSGWYYNQGTKENPDYMYFAEDFKLKEGDSGVYPLSQWKQIDTGYNNQKYNEITRKIYLPSVEELSRLVNLNDGNKVYDFLKGINDNLTTIWLRDANVLSPRVALLMYHPYRSLDGGDNVSGSWYGARPVFVIDLSKVNATVVDTVKYK